MKRVMLLTLLALALSTATLAQQLRYNTGEPAPEATANFTSGFTSPFTVDVRCPNCTVAPGSGEIGPVEISLTTPNLTDCPSTDCTFNTGTVTVTGLEGGSGPIFTANVLAPPDGAGGTIIVGDDNVIVDAELGPGFVGTTSFVGGTVNFGIPQPGPGGSGVVVLDGVLVPEPGTFVMLGTGLIGLAGMARRKLRLGA